MKPFSLQAPEEVAKEYGGNKQKIMQAAQTGIVDPTAAVLAGMFIDRMRNAAQAEQANPPTIAQQVMAPTPPPGMSPPTGAPGGPGGPPGGPGGPPPMPPSGGLGATPEAMGGTAPPMPPPPGGPPQMARGGKVEDVERAVSYLEGGLDALPVPDTMFDEGYADGGLVAFAGGGTSNADEQAFLRWKAALRQQESGGEKNGGYGAVNRQGSGAMGPFQLMPATARTHAQRLGIGYDQNLMLGNTPEARAYQDKVSEPALREAWKYGGGDPIKASRYHFAGPDESGHGPKTRQYERDMAGRLGTSKAADAGGDAPLEEEDIDTREGRRVTRADHRAEMKDFVDSLPKERREQYMKFLDEQMDPEAKKKKRSGDLWARLAEFGANLASTPGPLLSAAATAAKEPLKGVREDAATRDEAEAANLSKLLGIEGLEREDAFAAEKMATQLTAADIEAEGAEKTRDFTAEQNKLDRENKLAQIAAQIAGNLDIAKIRAQAAAAGGGNATDLELVANTTFNTLMQQREQGMLNYEKDGKQYVPSVQALKQRAIKTATELLGKTQPPMQIPGVTGGQGAAAAQTDDNTIHVGAI